MRPRTMTATVGLIALVAALPDDAEAAKIRVGVGDQSPSMFSHPDFQQMDLRQARYFVHWDAIRDDAERAKLRAWVKAARRSGARPLVHLSTTTFAIGRAPRPSVRRYRRDVGRLVRYLRRLGVRDFGTFNEANHKTQPTWDSPSHAALYFKEMYRAVHKTCSTRSCRVVALDVLDQAGAQRYIKRFYARLSPTWKRRAKIVGIHNYGDANRDRRRTGSMIREVRRANPRARFWFTETGGLVGFGRSFPCDPASASSVTRAERRAAASVRRVFRLARSYRASGVQRVYLYNWFGNNCAPSSGTEGRDAEDRADFDAGLVRADGSARPGLAELRRGLRSSIFSP